MEGASFGNLLLVVAAAVVTPLLLGLAPRLRLPAVVLEILAGSCGPPPGHLARLHRGRGADRGGAGLVERAVGAALVAVALLSVLLFPLGALALLTQGGERSQARLDEGTADRNLAGRSR